MSYQNPDGSWSYKGSTITYASQGAADYYGSRDASYVSQGLDPSKSIETQTPQVAGTQIKTGSDEAFAFYGLDPKTGTISADKLEQLKTGYLPEQIINAGEQRKKPNKEEKIYTAQEIAERGIRKAGGKVLSTFKERKVRYKEARKEGQAQYEYEQYQKYGGLIGYSKRDNPYGFADPNFPRLTGEIAAREAKQSAYTMYEVGYGGQVNYAPQAIKLLQERRARREATALKMAYQKEYGNINPQISEAAYRPLNDLGTYEVQVKGQTSEELNRPEAKRIVQEAQKAGAKSIQIYNKEGKPVGGIKLQGAEDVLTGMLMDQTEFSVRYSTPKEKYEGRSKQEQDLVDYLARSRRESSTIILTDKQGQVVGTTKGASNRLDIYKASAKYGELSIQERFTKEGVDQALRKKPTEYVPGEATVNVLKENVSVIASPRPSFISDIFGIDRDREVYVAQQKLREKMDIGDTLLSSTIEQAFRGELPSGTGRGTKYDIESGIAEAATIYIPTKSNVGKVLKEVNPLGKASNLPSRTFSLAERASEKLRIVRPKIGASREFTESVNAAKQGKLYRPTNPYRDRLPKDILAQDTAIPKQTIRKPVDESFRNFIQQTKREVRQGRRPVATLQTPKIGEPLDFAKAVSAAKAGKILKTRKLAAREKITTDADQGFRNFIQATKRQLRKQVVQPEPKAKLPEATAKKIQTVQEDPFYKPNLDEFAGRYTRDIVKGKKIKPKTKIEKIDQPRLFKEDTVKPKSGSSITETETAFRDFIQATKRQVRQGRKPVAQQQTPKIGASLDFTRDVEAARRGLIRKTRKLAAREKITTDADQGFRDFIQLAKRQVRQGRKPVAQQQTPKIGASLDFTRDVEAARRGLIRKSRKSFAKENIVKETDQGFRDFIQLSKRQVRQGRKPVAQLQTPKPKPPEITPKKIQAVQEDPFYRPGRHLSKEELTGEKEPTIREPESAFRDFIQLAKRQARKGRRPVAQTEPKDDFAKAVEKLNRITGRESEQQRTRESVSRTGQVTIQKTKQATETKAQQTVLINKPQQKQKSPLEPKSKSPITSKPLGADTKQETKIITPQQPSKEEERRRRKAVQARYTVQEETTYYREERPKPNFKASGKISNILNISTMLSPRFAASQRLREQTTQLTRPAVRTSQRAKLESIQKPLQAQRAITITQPKLKVITRQEAKLVQKQEQKTIPLIPFPIKPRSIIVPAITPRIIEKQKTTPKYPEPPPTRRPPVIFGSLPPGRSRIPKEPTKGKPKVDFLGNVPTTEIVGVYRKRADIIYGKERTSKLARKDITGSKKGNFVRSNERNVLSKPGFLFSEKKQRKGTRSYKKKGFEGLTVRSRKFKGSSREFTF